MTTQSTIEFPVSVAGTSLKATILSEEGTNIDFAYRVAFSDGYQDLFAFDEESGTLYGVEGENPAAYAEALENDLPILINLDTNKFYYLFQHNIDGEPVNIWIKEQLEDNFETSYGVFYQKHYHFELHKENNYWVISSRSKDPDNFIDEVLAERVKFVLDSLL